MKVNTQLHSQYFYFWYYWCVFPGFWLIILILGMQNTKNMRIHCVLHTCSDWISKQNTEMMLTCKNNLFLQSCFHGPRTVSSYNSLWSCLHRDAVKVSSKLLPCLLASSSTASPFFLCSCTCTFVTRLCCVKWKNKTKHRCHNGMLICCDIYLMWKQIAKCLLFAVRQSITVAASMANCTLNAPCPIVN